uniref:Secreted protein n=1 Tax=Salvator merianae TaxID=96440 RepID=A0A8D0DMV4_SALMN
MCVCRLIVFLSLFSFFPSFLQGGKKTYHGPCGGRDCSTGCKCFPEKGARHNLVLQSQVQHTNYHCTSLSGS